MPLRKKIKNNKRINSKRNKGKDKSANKVINERSNNVWVLCPGISCAHIGKYINICIQLNAGKNRYGNISHILLMRVTYMAYSNYCVIFKSIYFICIFDKIQI